MTVDMLPNAVYSSPLMEFEKNEQYLHFMHVAFVVQDSLYSHH